MKVTKEEFERIVGDAVRDALRSENPGVLQEFVRKDVCVVRHEAVENLLKWIKRLSWVEVIVTSLTFLGIILALLRLAWK